MLMWGRFDKRSTLKSFNVTTSLYALYAITLFNLRNSFNSNMRTYGFNAANDRLFEATNDRLATP